MSGCSCDEMHEFCGERRRTDNAAGAKLEHEFCGERRRTEKEHAVSGFIHKRDARIAAMEADPKDTVRRRDRAEAELAALNARRCETCGRLPGGCCIAEDLEIFSESPTPCCSRWAEMSTP